MPYLSNSMVHTFTSKGTQLELHSLCVILCALLFRVLTIILTFVLCLMRQIYIFFYSKSLWCFIDYGHNPNSVVQAFTAFS